MVGNIPFGNALFVLTSTLVFQIVARTFLSNFWSKTGIYLTSLGFFSALVLTLLQSPAFAPGVDSLFTSGQLNVVFIFSFCLSLFLCHLNFVVHDRSRDHEYLFFEVLFGIFGIVLLNTSSLMVMGFVAPLLMLLIATMPLVFNKLIGLRAITKGLVYVATLFVVWAALVALTIQHAETTNLAEISKKLYATEPSVLFFIWASGLAAIWSFWLLPPFGFFEKEYESTMSWTSFATFRWQVLLLTGLLTLHWTFSLTAVLAEGKFSWLSFQGLEYADILTLLIFALMAWCVVGVLRKERFHQFLTASLVLPLLFAVSSFLLGTLEGAAWGVLALLVFVSGSVLTASIMSLAGISLAIPINEVWQRISWKSLPVGLAMLFLLALLSPAGNQIFFQLIKGLSVFWFVEGNKFYWIVGLLAICTCATYIAVNAAHKTFHGYRASDVNLQTTPLILWHYILLIPFILLGIYPFPLYNYVKFALSALFK